MFEHTIRAHYSADGELLHHESVEIFSLEKGLVLFVALHLLWYMTMDAERFRL